MPKVASFRVAWSVKDQAYHLQETRDHTLLQVVPDSPAWFAWLDQVSSFAFSGKGGHYTARKERRPRGETYWYAYVGAGKKLSKKYLGRTADVTLARLEQVAVTMASQEPTPVGAPTIGATTLFFESLHADFPPLNTVEPNKRDVPLLAAKLHQPRPRSRLVSRSHLVERLQRSMEHAITLVSAPAGFGKTTLLTQWLAESGTPAAWLSLEPEDNDPVRFFLYVIAALQTVDARVGTTALELLRSPQPLPAETVVTLLANDLLHSTVGDFALVLDDYHVITSELLHRALNALVEHLPPQVHLILATRTDPPLPLARLRARAQLTEVRATDLRFSTEEASTFLRTSMGLDLSAADIGALEHRTEGWIAGLQLAALSLQGRADVSAFLAAFTGSQRFVLDYLSEEVLTRQPALVQSFLLHTSVLSRLSGPLCDAVTGEHSGQAMLEALERANLFVVALDDERGWYRYHHLFAEVLRSRLRQAEPGLVPELHRRASAWYEQHELVEEAVQHALAAAAFDRAARLIETSAIPVASRGHIHLVLDWLLALPDELVRANAVLCLHHAYMLAATQQIAAAKARLQAAERCIETSPQVKEDQALLGYLALVRAVIARQLGDLEGAVSFGQQGLELLPEGEMVERATVLSHVAQSCLVTGDVTARSEQLITDALASIPTPGNLFLILKNLFQMARLRVLQGRLRRAAALYEETRLMAPQSEGVQGLLGGAGYYFGMGELLCEWNQLGEAERLLSKGMEVVGGSLAVFADDATLGYLTLARLQRARGEYSQAQATLDAFVALAEARSYVPRLLSRVAAERAQVDLARGDLPAALSWAEQSGLSPSDAELPYLREREYLILARICIAQGREDPADPFLSDVLHLLDRLLLEAEAKARMGSALEILVLQSLALQALGDRARALSTLDRALKLASPDGYVRLFVDEGAPMVALLRQAYARGMAPDHVAALLSATGAPAPTVPAPAGPLLEPLTEREREVLRLLVKGLSNSAIAQELVITVGTVKRHVNSIYGKLAVNSRTQAVARAHALHLL